MDIIKDVKGNIVNIGDIIKFRYFDFKTMEKPKDIISKISEIDYKTKTVHLDGNYCCKNTTSSQWEIENGLDNEDYVIGGEFRTIFRFGVTGLDNEDYVIGGEKLNINV